MNMPFLSIDLLTSSLKKTNSSKHYRFILHAQINSKDQTLWAMNLRTFFVLHCDDNVTMGKKISKRVSTLPFVATTRRDFRISFRSKLFEHYKYGRIRRWHCFTMMIVPALRNKSWRWNQNKLKCKKWTLKEIKSLLCWCCYEKFFLNKNVTLINWLRLMIDICLWYIWEEEREDENQSVFGDIL